MIRKLLVLLAVLLACAGIVTASGSAEAASQGTALRMLWWGSESRHAPTLEALDLYAEKNPGVTVSGEYQGWDGYYQRIATQLAGGTAADIIQIDQPWLHELCTRGDVFAEIDTSIVDTSGFDPQFLEDYCTFEGTLVGLPTGVSVNTMVVDPAFLERFGIDPDTKWTWENMVEYGKMIHEADPTCYLNGASPDLFRYWWEMYIAQIAGGVVSEDKEIMFTLEQATQSFEYFKQWLDYGVVAPFSKTSLFFQKFHENPDWISGKMGLSWSWVASMEKDMSSRDMTTTTLPVMEGAENSGVLMRPAQLFVVSESSPNKEEAMKVLDFVFNDPEAVKILGTARAIPAVEGARATLVEAGLISELAQRATDEGIAQAGWPQSTWQMNSSVAQTMQDVIDEFGYGELTPEEAAAKMIESLEATLSRL